MINLDRGASKSPVGAERRSRYHTLDAMRGLAAICVVATHFQERYAPSAYLAVDFFFVLSGFIIAEIYGKRLSRGAGFSTFMAARVRRLYPLYLVGIFVGLVQIVLLTVWGLRQQGLSDLLASTVFNGVVLPTPMHFLAPDSMQGMFPINGPAWSMFWELLVNIIFALWLFRLPVRWLSLLAALSAACMVILSFKYGNLNIGWEWPSAIGGLPRVMFSFSAGIMISRLFGGSPAWSKSWVAFMPCLLLMILMVMPVPTVLRPYYDLTFAISVAPILIALGLFLEMPRRLEKLAMWAGYISYPVYILHRGILGVVKPLLGTNGLKGLAAFLCVLVFVVGFSYVVARLVEGLTAMRLRRA